MLKTTDLSERFGRNSLVLNGVSVAFDEASVIAIVGPSGSGRTTLLHCLLDMLRAISGKMLLDGVDVTGLGRRRFNAFRRASFGFILQDYDLINALTAVQNVRLPSLFDGTEMVEPRIREMLALVGLSGLENRYPAELSDGQRQWIAITRVLTTECGVVLTDELTGALDGASRWEVLEYFVALLALGSTVVVITYDLTVAAAASRMSFLCDGVIIDDRSGLGARDIAARLTDLEARS